MADPQRKPETTALPPLQERIFREWAKDRGVNDIDVAPYDYRGAFLAGVEPTVSSVDNKSHWPDTFKQHGHPTFSVESVYSRGPRDGGSWSGEVFFPSLSKGVVSDATAVKRPATRLEPLRQQTIGPAPADASAVSKTPRPTPGLLDLLKAAYDRGEQNIQRRLPEGTLMGTIPSYLQGEGPVAGKLAGGLRKVYEAYHGTPYGAFDRFKRGWNGIWSSDAKEVADTYRELTGNLRRGKRTPTTLRLELDLPNAIELDAKGSMWDKIPIPKGDAGLSDILRHYAGDQMSTESLLSLADKKGMDGVIIRNLLDPNNIGGRGLPPSTIFGVLDPRRIKILEALGLAGMAGAAAPER